MKVGTTTGDLIAPAFRPRVALDRRWFRSRWPGLLVVALVLPIAVVTTLGTFDWPGQPFPGFFVMGNGVVPTIGLYGWTGIRAGVPFHGRVVAVDGGPADGAAAIYDVVRSHPPGTPVAYTIEKGERRATFVVPTMTFGAADYWLTVGLFTLFGWLSVAAGVVVFLVRPALPSARAFLVHGALTGLWALTGAALYHPDQWWLSRLHFVAQACFPAAFVHLGLMFPEPRRVVETRRWIVAIPYTIGVALAAWTLVAFYADPPSVTPLHACYLFTAVGIVVCALLLVWGYVENRAPQTRAQLRSLLPAFVVATAIAPYAFLNTAASGGDFPMNLVAFTPFVFYLTVGWSIARHDLFGIGRVLRHTLVYAGLTLAVTLGYAAMVAVTTLLQVEWTPGTAMAAHVVAIVAAAAMFEPARRRLQRAVDRLFWRERVDYRQTVASVSAALATLRDLDEILDRLGHTVHDGLRLRSFHAVLWHEGATRTWVWGAKERRMLEIAAGSFAALRDAIAHDGGAYWQVLSTAGDDDPIAFVPLVVAGRAVGAFGLGRRRSGMPFSGEDVALLGTLAAQSAIAIENARSVRALEELAAALEAKVRERTGELESRNSELAAAMRDLQRAQGQLVHSEKMASLGVLVAGVAHEINNPVSFIVGNVAPLRETLEALAARAAAFGDADVDATIARIRRAFDVIARGAERTAGIVNDLRTFSRLGEGQPLPVDVHDAVEVTLRLLRPLWAGRITIHREYGSLPPVEAIPGQLNQVFMNLLANACEAIAGAGNVWIRTASQDGGVMLEVRDDGPGIAPGDLPRLFDPFFTTKAQGKGTGLGLAISHGIVQQHGGSMQAQNVAGGGAAFRVTLPAARRAGAAA